MAQTCTALRLRYADLPSARPPSYRGLDALRLQRVRRLRAGPSGGQAEQQAVARHAQRAVQVHQRAHLEHQAGYGRTGGR